MADVVCKHTFVSAKADTADATLVQPSNWNDEHKFSGGSDGESLVRLSTAADGAEWAERLVRPTRRNTAWVNFVPGNAAPNMIGGPALTTGGTLADGGLADLASTQFSTSSNGIVLGLRPNVSVGQFMSKYDPTLIVRLKTGPSLANARFLIGFAFGATWNADNLAASQCGVRYSTSAGDAGWIGVARSDVGSQGVTAQIAAIATSTEYLIKVVLSGDGTLATFSVDGASQTLSGASLPTTNQNMNWNVNLTNLAAEAKSFIGARVYLEWD